MPAILFVLPVQIYEIQHYYPLGVLIRFLLTDPGDLIPTRNYKAAEEGNQGGRLKNTYAHQKQRSNVSRETSPHPSDDRDVRRTTQAEALV